jgi:hypothetical protein
MTRFRNIFWTNWSKRTQQTVDLTESYTFSFSLKLKQKYIFNYWITHKQIKDSAPIDSMHSLTSLFPSFLPE